MARRRVRGKKETPTLPDAIAISRTDETTHGAYRAEIPGTPGHAELTWLARDRARIATHTFVPPGARGKGIARQLVEAMVSDAREQGFAIVPRCGYVEALFRRHPGWADVRAERND